MNGKKTGTNTHKADHDQSYGIDKCKAYGQAKKQRSNHHGASITDSVAEFAGKGTYYNTGNISDINDGDRLCRHFKRGSGKIKR